MLGRVLALSISANAQSDEECFEKVSRGIFNFNQGLESRFTWRFNKEDAK